MATSPSIEIGIAKNGTTTLATAGKYCESNVNVNVNVPIPDGYIKPSGNKSITANGTHDVTQYASVVVNVPVPSGYIKPSGSKSITENGTHDVTQYASAVVNVETAKPTQFTNYYKTEYVTLDYKVSVSSNVVTKAANNEVNLIKIPYSHKANEPVNLRMRGIDAVRSNLVYVLYAADGETRINHGYLSSCTLSYDEYGDAVITLPANALTISAWEYIELNFQYPGLSSASTAFTGPIITINEPIGNGGYVG